MRTSGWSNVLLLAMCCVITLAQETTGQDATAPPAHAQDKKLPDTSEALPARARIRWDNVPRKVLAFYYPWYGNPDVSGRWVHWNGVDAAAKTIASSTHYPTLGAYDSHDPATIQQHCRWAKAAGIDGLISSWWSARDFHDRPLPKLLEAARQEELEVCVYYEQVPRAGDPASAVEDFLYLLEQYGSHPAWLKVQGKPVIFVYERAAGELSIDQWAQVLVEVNRRHPQGAFVLADQLSRPASLVFDGIHTYNVADKIQNKQVNEIAASMAGVFETPLSWADRSGRIGCVTVIPGYDDTKIRKPGIKAERFGGESYRRQWQAVRELDPHWSLITSFNEWHEGSQIEPSAEFGDFYLPLTAELVRRWKSAPPRRARSSDRGGPSAADIETLKKKLKDIPIGVLPDAQSSAAYWLVEKGLSPTFLRWDQVLDGESLTPGRFPLLLYAGSEHYTQTRKNHGDVDAAIERYARAGGCVVAIPSLPFPFFYNEQGKSVESAAKFGFPISAGTPPGQTGGFEQPPPGTTLAFASVSEPMSHVPKSFPFPSGGDRRWRPLMGRQLPPGDLFVPLVELRDQQGQWWGDGAAYIEHRISEPKGAKSCYVWFRLPELPQGDWILFDVFSFLAGRVQAKEE